VVRGPQFEKRCSTLLTKRNPRLAHTLQLDTPYESKNSHMTAVSPSATRTGKNYHQDRSRRSHFLHVTSGAVLPNKGAEVTEPRPHGRFRFPANFTPDGTVILSSAPNHILQLFSYAH